RDDQLAWMEESGQFDSGWGALVFNGLFVIDVDARNGGLESFDKLAKDHPGVEHAGLIVETGSEDGSRHYYFRFAGGFNAALKQSMNEYPGVDFKSSGYVVGPGSKHASGGRYTVAVGSIYDLDPPPDSLVEALKKPDKHRANINGVVHDVTDADIIDMLSHVDPDAPYGKWIRCGMAVHEATDGTGYEI